MSREPRSPAYRVRGSIIENRMRNSSPRTGIVLNVS